MKVTDLIDALEKADQLFREKYKTPLEIFDFQFSEDDYDGDIHIMCSGNVEYSQNFGWGQKTGFKPQDDIRIGFLIVEGKVSSSQVRFEEIE